MSLSASGICGTDIALAVGHLGPCHDVLGLQGVGHIVGIGPGIDPSTAKIGARDGVAWVGDIGGN